MLILSKKTQKACCDDILVCIQHTERVNEGEVARNGLKLSMGDEAIFVVVIVLEHRLKNRNIYTDTGKTAEATAQ